MDCVQTKDVHSVVYMEEAEDVFYTLNPTVRLMKTALSRLLKCIVWTNEN